jgi:hypothetical protein
LYHPGWERKRESRGKRTEGGDREEGMRHSASQGYLAVMGGGRKRRRMLPWGRR